MFENFMIVLGDKKKGYFANVDFLNITDNGIHKIDMSTYAFYVTVNGDKAYITDAGGIHTEIIANKIFRMPHDEFMRKLRYPDMQKNVRDNFYENTVTGRYWEDEQVMTFRSFAPSYDDCVLVRDAFKKENIDITKTSLCFDLYFANKTGSVILIPFNEYLDMRLKHRVEMRKFVKRAYDSYKKQLKASPTPSRMQDLYDQFDIKDENGHRMDIGELGWRLHAYEEGYGHRSESDKVNECGETCCPNVPPCSMGAISFPQGGDFGSGDVVCTSCSGKRKRKRVKPYAQRPANTVMTFDEFVNIGKQVRKS